ncbi:exodeoxyribonuclease V subunit beta [Alteromonas sp. C1M14]|uniref:exodeoxyribonuclease V subunit beta n=1 Tax=Alteromonas sp. C1M14 TaxID=2841567 RepID=UPI001C087F18|nr:exodeoxyribonuclease V subunit beta [Alteromonas sp. C1M14]MBU2977148.1 exodeoxyribonuclease V subunit beta [Alteromonas sp. C1M14]
MTGHVDNSQPLDVLNMPLQGRHLIEASAGTGKTFNITRIYLRLLLEKSLCVQQILVMTYTNAATEEIKGRVAETLREARGVWRDVLASPSLLAEQDPTYQGLYQVAPGEDGLQKLEAALLELDEASVFTIHGFCNKVISELAFASGSSMALTLETDTQEFWQAAAQDWVRKTASNEEAYAILVANGWHIPERFIRDFEKPLQSDLKVEMWDAPTIEKDHLASLERFKTSKQDIFAQLFAQMKQWEGVLSEHLIESKSGKDRLQREREWQALLDWLSQGIAVPPSKEAENFTKAQRYSRHSHKEQLKDILYPVYELIKEITGAHKAREEKRKAKLDAIATYQLVAEGFDYIRQHVATAKQRLGILDFDDLIKTLAQQVTQEGSLLREALRERYPVALIDEFQDTDASQYQILSQVYSPGGTEHLLMMIGDPKQAIYGFRGGDIFTYLKAGRQADYRWVMDTNWRSVAPMVNAYNRLFYGDQLAGAARDVFGFGIQYIPVNSTPHAKAAGLPLEDLKSRQALNFVVYEPEEDDDVLSEGLTDQLVAWTSHEIHRLLAEAKLGEQRVQPADIAILVRSGTEAQLIQSGLKKVGLSAVYLSTNTPLFSAEEAADLYRVLDGIWHCDDKSRLCGALSSPLLGYDHNTIVAMLHDEDDALWEACMARILKLREVWVKQGCMAVVLMMLRRWFVLRDTQTERHLTNYLHLAESLERTASVTPRPEQLLLWLHQNILDPQGGEDLVQRLESDAKLIQIVTMHGSKGLEYPIVFVPFANKYKDPAKSGNRQAHGFRYFDERTDTQRLQLGYSEEAEQNVRAQGRAEEMRLLYVAITRAAHRCYLGVAPFKHSEQSALAKALGLDGPNQWVAAISKIIDEQGMHTTVLDAGMLPVSQQGDEMAKETRSLRIAQFTGSVKDNWRLYSFSALARQQVAVKHTQRDEEIVDNLLEPEARSAEHLFRFAMEKGANAGNLLHDLLEMTDFTEPAWLTHREMGTRLNLNDQAFDALAEWMDEVLATPLSSSLCLNALPASQTLKESEFYFPINQANWRTLKQLLNEHRLTLSPNHAIPVPNVSTPQLEGMMHGFIDLLFEYEGRFYVADYKSTHLGYDFGHYSQDAMINNNQKHLYDLQYLLYALALHRHLKNHLPDYTPSLHFGGVYYLYLRGMHPNNQASEGVFYTPVSEEQLHALDDLFSGIQDEAC